MPVSFDQIRYSIELAEHVHRLTQYMGTAFLLALALTLKQGQFYSYESNAKPLKDQLVSLSTLTGKQLKASPILQSDIVVLRQKDRTSDQILAQLAEAERAVWKQEGLSLKLEPDVALRKRLYNERIAERVSTIQKAISKLKASIPEPFSKESAKRLYATFAENGSKIGPSGDFKTFEQLKPRMPAFQALCGILSNIDLSILAQDGSEPIVFTDIPTTLQYNIGQKAVQAIRELEKNQSIWADVCNTDNAEQTNQGRYTADTRLYRDIAEPGSLHAILKVSRENDNYLFITAWFINENFELRQFSETSISFDSARRNTSIGSSETEESYPIPKEALDAKTMLETVRDGNKLPEELTRPDKHDPLSLVVGPILLDSARRRDISLVANLSDYAYSSYSPIQTAAYSAIGKATKYKTSRFLNSLFAMNHQVNQSDKEWTISPSIDTTQVDRADLGAILRNSAAQGCPSFEDTLKLALMVSTRNLNTTFIRNYMDAALPGLSASLEGWTLQNARFLARLTDSQRTSLLQGKRLLISQLPKPAQMELSQMMLRDNNGFSDIGVTRRPSKFIMMDHEPSIILAKGIDPRATISLDSRSEDKFLRKTPYGYRVEETYSLARLFRNFEKGTKHEHEEKVDSNQLRGWPVKSTLFTTTIMLTPTLVYRSSFNYDFFNLRASQTSYSSMPKTFIDQVHQMQERELNND